MVCDYIYLSALLLEIDFLSALGCYAGRQPLVSVLKVSGFNFSWKGFFFNPPTTLNIPFLLAAMFPDEKSTDSCLTVWWFDFCCFQESVVGFPHFPLFNCWHFDYEISQSDLLAAFIPRAVVDFLVIEFGEILTVISLNILSTLLFWDFIAQMLVCLIVSYVSPKHFPFFRSLNLVCWFFYSARSYLLLKHLAEFFFSVLYFLSRIFIWLFFINF